MLHTLKRAGLMAGMALVLAMIVPAGQAGAKGGPPGTEEGLGNNLSVPTYFVPSTTGAPALRTPCPTDVVPADGPTVVYNEIAYYLQKTEAVWSAKCGNLAGASVTAAWGANLTNDRAIRAGKPIRVEMALLSADTGTGFDVVNLTPDLPDRNSTYGTTGDANESMQYMVWAAGATLTISQGDVVVYSGPFTTEVNSTGKVVYGYNWGTGGRTTAPKPGTYELTFTVPAVITITGNVDEGVLNTSFTPQTSTVTINVTAGGGGGGHS